MASEPKSADLIGPEGQPTSDGTPALGEMVADDGSGDETPPFIVTDKDADGLTAEQRKAVEGRVKHFQADYSKKTEELARKAKDIEEQQKRNLALANELETTLSNVRENPPLARPTVADPALAALSERFEGEDLQAIQTLVRAEMKALEDRLGEKLNPVLAQSLRADAQSSVEAFLAKPENEHFRQYRDDVVQWYQKTGNSPENWPMVNLFRHLDYERLSGQIEEARKTGKLEAIQGIARANQRSVASGSSPQPVNLKPVKTLLEGWEQAGELVRRARAAGE